MGISVETLNSMKASLCVAALVAAASAAPQLHAGHGAVGGLVGGPGLVGGVAGHGLVGGVAGHGLVGGVAHAAVAPAIAVAPAVAVGAGQVSHQSVHKPLQGENRGVTQSKAFGSSVAAVADHPSTTHGVGANRVGPALVSTGVVGHSVVAPVAHGVVGHGLVGGIGHGAVAHSVVGHGVSHGLVGGVAHGVGVGGVFNGYTGYNGTPFLNAAIAG